MQALKQAAKSRDFRHYVEKVEREIDFRTDPGKPRWQNFIKFLLINRNFALIWIKINKRIMKWKKSVFEIHSHSQKKLKDIKIFVKMSREELLNNCRRKKEACEYQED